jgi:hypothetical protein
VFVEFFLFEECPVEESTKTTDEAQINEVHDVKWDRPGHMDSVE